jgi:hypothetical protein
VDCSFKAGKPSADNSDAPVPGRPLQRLHYSALPPLQVKNYFNTAGYERWRKIYGETSEVNKVQLDIRTGHAQTVEKVLRWVDAEGSLQGVTVCDAGCGTGAQAARTIPSRAHTSPAAAQCLLRSSAPADPPFQPRSRRRRRASANATYGPQAAWPSRWRCAARR